MSETGSAGQPPTKLEKSPEIPGQETLSQLLARILDQLNISAWFPAAALVFLLLLIGSLHAKDGDLQEAIRAIASMKVQSLVLLTGAVILATMLTQAFQFEAIRLMEGYWGPGRLSTALSDVLCRRHLDRRNRLKERRDDLARQAFALGRPAMLKAGHAAAVIDAMGIRVAGGQLEPSSANLLKSARPLPWLRYVRPPERRRLDALTRAIEQYPKADHFVRATCLGNTLMAYEEKVLAAGVGHLETFVQEVFHVLPETIQTQHDHFRSRLDLYCSLVLVFFLSGLTSIVVLADDAATVIAVTSGLAAVTWLSYRAAITSARGYGSILEIIAKLTGPRS